MAHFSLSENVIIKSAVPPCGIVSSNPERTKRLQQALLVDAKELVSSWGVTVFVGKCQDQTTDLFFASVPMGASGSAHAFHELMAAGAQSIVRLGSNDVWVTENHIDSLVIVKETRGLRGLSWDHGIAEDEIDQPILSDSSLMDFIMQEAQARQMKFDQRVCFNVDDYHAYLHPELSQNPNRIQQRLAYYESFAPYCRDMESAALYLKGQEFGVRTACILQNVIKQKKGAPYADQSGALAKQFELKIAALVMAVLQKI